MTHRIVILGAGISGLASAWFLKRRFKDKVSITLIEKDCRVGGWIDTQQINGFLFEKGPRSCRSKGTGRETLQLAEALGLEEELIAPAPAAKIRYIYRKGELHALPKGPLSLPFNTLMQGWLSAFWQDWTAPRCQEEDESVASFFSRRLGKAWCDRLIDPFMTGIYAGDITKLSMRSCLPLLWNFEKQYGSLLRGALKHPRKPPAPTPFVKQWEKTPFFSFKRGMETLPLALKNQVDAEFFLNAEIGKLHVEKGIKIDLKDRTIEADSLISTLPPAAFASLLNPSEEIVNTFNQLEYASVQVISLGYAKKVFLKQGFGYLIPSEEKESILGCVWDSSAFPDQNQSLDETRLTVMIKHLGNGEKQALEAVERHLGISEAPDALHVKNACYAIPQYSVGHCEWKKSIESIMQRHYNNIFQIGPAFGGVSVNDCIAQAQKLAGSLCLLPV